MDISLGTSGSESTFTNTVVGISRQPVISTHTAIDGSVQVQKAPTTKKAFAVTLVKPSSGEVTNIETEFAKDTTLFFIHDSITYTVRCVGSLDKSTDRFGITLSLQEV